MSQLRPFDILVIQTTIEEYKRRYPHRETPSAEVALAWRLGRRKKQQGLAGTLGLLRIYESFRARWMTAMGPSKPLKKQIGVHESSGVDNP
jgi:hypothetical protein